jgi:hypothetical protein
MLSGIKRLGSNEFYRRVKASCPEREMQTVGVADLLTTSDAPPVIDYVNLDVGGAELDILRAFPFERYCVRAWTVEHNCEEPKKSYIKQILESHGCRVEEVEVDWWASCPCGAAPKDDKLSLVRKETSAFDDAYKTNPFTSIRKISRHSPLVSHRCKQSTSSATEG